MKCTTFSFWFKAYKIQIPVFLLWNSSRSPTTATRSDLSSELTYQSSSHASLYRDFYFHCMHAWSGFGIPSLLVDYSLSLSTISSIKLCSFCEHTSPKTLTHAGCAHFIWCVHVTGVPNCTIPLISVNNLHLLCFVFNKTIVFFWIWEGGQ